MQALFTLSKKILFFTGILLFTLSGCKDSTFSIFPIEKRLTRHNWKIKSIINHDTGNAIEPPNSIYDFRNDGSLAVHVQGGEIQHSTWELQSNNNYLRIGNNTFKIKIITDKLISLQYGSVDVFYIAVD